MSCLKDKTALITGATGGLGSAIAFELAEKGINLILTSTDKSGLSDLRKKIKRFFKTIKIEIIQADLIKSENSLIRQFERGGIFENTTIDILVNNAAIFKVKSLIESSEDEIIQTMWLNSTIPILLSKKFSKRMVENKFGRIINIGSSSSYSGFKNTVSYCSSKHALLGFSRALHQELKSNGVRVYCISPGSLKTEMGRKVVGQNFETFIESHELARLIFSLIEYNGNMIPDEVRVNRMETQ
jgi:short-subunit dehydrogenase